ncbi:MAG: hypothetical protein M0Z31_02630 [Clostridia bacterium]|nr:hypothetical protein [Clostridia bacterium]
MGKDKRQLSNEERIKLIEETYGVEVLHDMDPVKEQKCLHRSEEKGGK